jgi:hypothetical protein
MANKDSGWVKLHRTSFNNSLYFSEPFTKWQAWCDLILLANYKEGVLLKRGIRVTVPRGSTGWSIDDLSKRWKWSRNKCEHFMQYLEGQTVKQIVRQKTNITTLISIVNYDFYQNEGNANDDAKGNAKGNANDTLTRSIKNNTVNTLVKKGQENENEFNSTSINNNLSGEQLFAKRFRDRLENETNLNGQKDN